MTKITIERLDHQGRGIGYNNNKIVFVENALPKERVEVEIIEENKKYDCAKVKKLEQASEKRVTPFCPYYAICGGCQLQHLNYEDTFLYKEEKVKNIMKRNHIEIPEIMKVANESPRNYRNKLSVKVVEGKIGFYEEKSHHLIEIESCALAKKSINRLLKQLHKFHIKNGLVTIRANYNDELLIVITTEEKIMFSIEEFENVKIVGIVINKETRYGNNFFYERMNQCLFKVSYDAFFQVNPFITSKLFAIIENHVEKNNNVLDLYSGVGTLGIVASKKAEHVCSVEIIKNAVLDNMENKKLNNRENIDVFLGDASKVLPKLNYAFDTLIIDPPRKGLDKNSTDIILNSNAKQILYISCDPLTLARDLKVLMKNYEIKSYYMLDMFSFTYHVESVCVLKIR